MGQIRLGRNLPWEESGYFCLFNEELVKYDESYIGRVFEEAGLHIRYDSAEGRYLVTRPDRRVAGAVKLVVFSKEGQLQEVIEPTYYRYKPYILKLDNAHLLRVAFGSSSFGSLKPEASSVMLDFAKLCNPKATILAYWILNKVSVGVACRIFEKTLHGDRECKSVLEEN